MRKKKKRDRREREREREKKKRRERGKRPATSWGLTPEGKCYALGCLRTKGAHIALCLFDV